MTVQVLVATMHQKDYSLLEKMNIQSDSIIANQCDTNIIDNFTYHGHNISFLTFNDIGVGINRNNALMRASADICILADDDMRFVDGYEERVNKAFADHNTADVIIFNLIGNDRNGTNSVVKVGSMNYMKYGASRIAFRRKKLSYLGIYFNQNFGGGTGHSCGEDTIFLNNCLKAGLKIIHIPEAIAELDSSSESTWFKGYNEKFFYDRGVLHTVMYKNSLKFKTLIRLFNYIYILRHRSLLSKEITLKKACKIMDEAVGYYISL